MTRTKQAKTKTKTVDVEQIVQIAKDLIFTSPEEALSLANHARQQVEDPAVYDLLGEIHVEMQNDADAADSFLQAQKLDPDGNAARFLWLAQLSTAEEAAQWYDLGIALLRDEPTRLCSSLCGKAELFMTDLCEDPQAEQICEAALTEALLIESAPEAWQTLASLRIGQGRMDEAKRALFSSMEWRELSPEDPKMPSFPLRLNLSRLLMEVDMLDEAVDVLERLLEEDNMTVDGWYLLGFARYTRGQSSDKEEEWLESRESILKAQEISGQIGNGDEGVLAHCQEMLREIDSVYAREHEQDDSGEERELDWEDVDEMEQ